MCFEHNWRLTSFSSYCRFYDFCRKNYQYISTFCFWKDCTILCSKARLVRRNRISIDTEDLDDKQEDALEIQKLLSDTEQEFSDRNMFPIQVGLGRRICYTASRTRGSSKTFGIRIWNWEIFFWFIKICCQFRSGQCIQFWESSCYIPMINEVFRHFFKIIQIDLTFVDGFEQLLKSEIFLRMRNNWILRCTACEDRNDGHFQHLR